MDETLLLKHEMRYLPKKAIIQMAKDKSVEFLRINEKIVEKMIDTTNFGNEGICSKIKDVFVVIFFFLSVLKHGCNFWNFCHRDNIGVGHSPLKKRNHQMIDCFVTKGEEKAVFLSITHCMLDDFQFQKLPIFFVSFLDFPYIPYIMSGDVSRLELIKDDVVVADVESETDSVLIDGFSVDYPLTQVSSGYRETKSQETDVEMTDTTSELIPLTGKKRKEAEPDTVDTDVDLAGSDDQCVAGGDEDGTADAAGTPGLVASASTIVVTTDHDDTGNEGGNVTLVPRPTKKQRTVCFFSVKNGDKFFSCFQG